MIEGQFELDGYLFGCDLPVEVRDFSPGDRVIAVQDTTVPGGPGRMMGRDYDDGPEWTFDLTVTGDATFDTLEALRTAWQADGVAQAPGALSVLRYALPGRVRRVYGRPRRFAPVDGAVGLGWHFDHLPVIATFQLTDPLVYADAEESLELGLVQSSSAGLVLPATLPWTLGVPSGQRQGQVTVGGKAPAPFVVTFHGPTVGTASGLWAAGAGWRVDLDTDLPAGQSITVDTREHTVTRSDGRSLVGAARGRFLSARLSPGAQEFAFGAADATNTARAVLSWRPAFYSI